jgi:hypothetical protein
MAAPVSQMKQKRESVRPDGLPKSSSSDGRKEKQSSNTCQALNGMDCGWWTRDEAGQDATTVQAVVAEDGLRRPVSLPRGKQVVDNVL